MVTRIHYTEAGIEYVLQYKRNSKTDKVELRIHRYTLIGGIPNHFQDTGGVLCSEIDAFKEHLLEHRPVSRNTPLPEFSPEFAYEEMTLFPALTDAEIEAIDTFEDIAEVYLRLTPNSVEKYRRKLRENPSSLALLTLQRVARQLQGLDFTPLMHTLNSMVANLNTASQVAALQMESLVGVDITRRVNYREILARYLNTPIPPEDSTDDPPPETEAPTDVNDAILDRFLKEIEEAIEDHGTDRVRGAPTHPISLPDTLVTSLSRQNRPEDDEA